MLGGTNSPTYAASNGTVIKLTGSGVPLQTNILNQLAGLVQRDSAGNFYFASVFLPAGPGTGHSLDYGTTNSCYLAKFTAAGALVWSNGFGPTGALKNIQVTDLQLDTNGDVYAGLTYNTSLANYFSRAARFDASGSNIWTADIPTAQASPIGSVILHLGALSPTNGYAVTYEFDTMNWHAILSRFDSNSASVITNWTDSDYTPPLLRDSSGNFYSMEKFISGGANLTKRDPSGVIIWQRSLSYPPASLLVGADPNDGVLVATDSSQLSRWNSAGKVWRGPRAFPARAKAYYQIPWAIGSSLLEMAPSAGLEMKRSPRPPSRALHNP